MVVVSLVQYGTLKVTVDSCFAHICHEFDRNKIRIIWGCRLFQCENKDHVLQEQKKVAFLIQNMYCEDCYDVIPLNEHILFHFKFVFLKSSLYAFIQ